MKCEVKDKDMGMGHLWFNGWGIHHLMGGHGIYGLMGWAFMMGGSIYNLNGWGSQLCFAVLQVIKNWRQEWPRNEASPIVCALRLKLNTISDYLGL